MHRRKAAGKPFGKRVTKAVATSFQLSGAITAHATPPISAPTELTSISITAVRPAGERPMASALSKALAVGRPARLRLQGKEMIVSHIKRIALAYCVATAMLAGCNDRQISAIPAAASFSQQKVSRSGHQD